MCVLGAEMMGVGVQKRVGYKAAFGAVVASSSGVFKMQLVSNPASTFCSTFAIPGFSFFCSYLNCPNFFAFAKESLTVSSET